MVHAEVSKLILDGHGSFLGMEKGCFTVKDREGNFQKYCLRMRLERLFLKVVMLFLVLTREKG